MGFWSVRGTRIALPCFGRAIFTFSGSRVCVRRQMPIPYILPKISIDRSALRHMNVDGVLSGCVL